MLLNLTKQFDGNKLKAKLLWPGPQSSCGLVFKLPTQDIVKWAVKVSMSNGDKTTTVFVTHLTDQVMYYHSGAVSVKFFFTYLLGVYQITCNVRSDSASCMR